MAVEIQKQEKVIQEFNKKLYEFESKVENEAKASLESWKEKLRECDVSVNRQGMLDASMLGKIFLEFMKQR